MNYNQVAIAVPEKLNEVQARGVSDYQLTSEQVQVPNFGPHTLIAIDFLRKEKRAENHQSAFAIVSGLNQVQVVGVLNYQLTREQVQAPNFGWHSIHTTSTDSDEDRRPARNR